MAHFTTWTEREMSGIVIIRQKIVIIIVSVKQEADKHTKGR